MNSTQRLLVGGVLLLASLGVTAGNEVKVFGQPSCMQWSQLTSNGKKKWLLGFLSGMNHGYAVNHKGHDPLDQVESDKQIYDWMDAFCRANPGLDVSDGGVALFKVLKSQ